MDWIKKMAITSRMGDGDKEKTDTNDLSTPQHVRTLFDPRSPSDQISRTPVEVLRTPVLPLSTPLRQRLHVADPRSPSRDFIRTPIVLNVTDEKTPQSSPKLLETRTKLVAQPAAKRCSLVGLLETNLDYVETDLDSADLSGAVVDEVDLKVSVDKCVEELDKKLTDLIFEDKSKIRTPLADRQMNQRAVKRPVPVLKVNDRPTRPKNKPSKIPVFQDKRMKVAGVQCENTPPRITNNRSRWDGEDSFII